MGNFADKLGNMISEAVYGVGYSDPIYRNLKGFYATDKQLDDFTYTGSENRDQVVQQVVENKKDRDYLFNQVDLIRHHHLAATIKDIIIDDCFNSMCDKNLATVKYRSDDKETNELFDKEILDLFGKTSFLEVLKDCLINEGIDYGEMFLSTDCRVGEGIIEIRDDVDIKKHIAIYRNLTPIGYIRFNNTNNKINPEDFMKADDLSHFLVNPKKISLNINYDYNKSYELPEKIRCAEPILTPVIDLIVEYNCLEKVRTAIELNKALAPILLGVGVSSTSDMNEIRKQLQQYSIAINKTRNAVLNNLNNLNVNNLLANMNPVQLIPYDAVEGNNAIHQIEVKPIESDLTEKLNDMKKCIAQAVGVPENYLATTTLIIDKGENILTNARYSRMLSGIQQSLARGIVEFVYKHLKYRFSKLDSEGKQYLTKEIDRNKIEVKFKSVTNVDNRLDMEQMLLTANTMSEIAGVVDVVTGSPNLPVKTNADAFLTLWRNTTEPYPFLRDIFEEDPDHQDNMDMEDFDLESEFAADDEIDQPKKKAAPTQPKIDKAITDLKHKESKDAKPKTLDKNKDGKVTKEDTKGKKDSSYIRDTFK